MHTYVKVLNDTVFFFFKDDFYVFIFSYLTMLVCFHFFFLILYTVLNKTSGDIYPGLCLMYLYIYIKAGPHV